MANEHHYWKDDESTQAATIIDLTFSLWNVTPVTVQVSAGGPWREDADAALAMIMRDTLCQVALEDCYHAEVDGRRVLVREIDGCIQYREPDDAPSVVGPTA